MLCEEDQQLFLAARRAQVNRNTAIHVFENYRTNAMNLLLGGFVRVLLELPATHNEDYALARITGTVEGAPYNGFSTNSSQETATYLMLRLPRQLADLNGEQFQLNSVSNSAMNEAEFVRWLQVMRADGEPLPTVAELEVVGSKVQSLESTRRPRYISRGHRSSTIMNHQGTAMASREPPKSAPGGNAGGPSGAFTGNGNSMSAPALPHAPSPSTGSPSLGESLSNSSPNINGLYNGGGRRPATHTGSPPPPTQPGGGFFAEGPQPPPPPLQQRQLARQGAPPDRSMSSLVDAGTLSTQLNRGAPSHFPATGAEVALQSATAVAVADAEETEADRRLRQDVMNQLQASCTLFPRECSKYKLSQLRTAERDMIEFLEHVREEIMGKQDNCVVCLDHLPTVILLPCRHKALCRLCASTQATCPMCRMAVKEMFEPQEI